MRPIIQISLPVITLTILLTGILRFDPIVFVVESKDNIPAIIPNPLVLKAGQIWQIERDTDNPFDDKERASAQIVAIKDGYVKYYFWRNESYGKAQSDSADTFTRVFTKRIK